MSARFDNVNWFTRKYPGQSNQLEIAALRMETSTMAAWGEQEWVLETLQEFESMEELVFI
jgi:hypothetical protein